MHLAEDPSGKKPEGHLALQSAWPGLLNVLGGQGRQDVKLVTPAIVPAGHSWHCRNLPSLYVARKQLPQRNGPWLV